MPSQEDLIRLYQEKIHHIEDQIKNIEAHIRELDAFEASQMRRNLPNEYKQSLHSAITRAKMDAGTVKNKAKAAVMNLKAKVLEKRRALQERALKQEDERWAESYRPFK
jgi:uncharacterized protein (DUF342 family)